MPNGLEHAFQGQLDDNYEDDATRGVYADWLDEMETHPEAEVQRALSNPQARPWLLRRLPDDERSAPTGKALKTGSMRWEIPLGAERPEAACGLHPYALAPTVLVCSGSRRLYRTRREAEAALANAWVCHEQHTTCHGLANAIEQAQAWATGNGQAIYIIEERFVAHDPFCPPSDLLSALREIQEPETWDFHICPRQPPQTLRHWRLSPSGVLELHEPGNSVQGTDEHGYIAVCDDDQSADVLRTRADKALTSGDYDGAIANATSAIRLDPAETPAYFTRFHAHMARGEYDLAGQVFEEVSTLIDPWANDELLEAAAQRRDQVVKALTCQGREQLQNKLYSEAINAFDQALHLNPRQSMLYVRRGEASYRSGDYCHAIRDFDEALEQGAEESVELLWFRGRAHLRTRKFDRSIADFGAIIDRNSEHVALSYCLRGVAHRENRNLEQALSDFDAALKHDLSLVGIYALRGQVYRSRRQVDEARIAFRTALEQDPRFRETIAQRFADGTIDL